MNRILLAALPARQHTNALLSIAQALQTRGCDVAFLAFPTNRPLLQAQGLTLIDSTTGAGTAPAGAKGPFRFSLPSQAREVARVAGGWRAAAVVADAAFPAAALGAELAGVPWATVYTDGLPFPGPAVPPAGSGLPIGEDCGWRNLLAMARATAAQKQEDARLWAGRKSLGLGPADWPLAGRVSPWLTLALTTEAIEAPRDLLPETLFLAGPCRAPSLPAAGSDVPIGPLRAGLPRVYVSLAATFQQHPAFFAVVVQALAALKVQIILDLGTGLPSGQSAGVPPNVVAVRGLPPAAVLPRADLVLTDGEPEVVTEALAQGKPMLVAPTGGTRADNAARVEFLGAGLRVDPRRATRYSLRGQVERLLGESACRARAMDLSRSLACTDGPSVAAGLIERLVRTGAPVRRPAGCTASLFRDSPLPWESRDLLVVR